MDVVLQGNGEAVHEGGAGRDGVAVKHIRFVLDRNLDALLGELLTQLLFLLLLHRLSLAHSVSCACLYDSVCTSYMSHDCDSFDSSCICICTCKCAL